MGFAANQVQFSMGYYFSVVAVAVVVIVCGCYYDYEANTNDDEKPAANWILVLCA